MPERNKGSSRLHFSEEKTEAKVEKAAARVKKIRTNIPKKKTLSVTRATDEATGKPGCAFIWRKSQSLRQALNQPDGLVSLWLNSIIRLAKRRMKTLA